MKHKIKTKYEHYLKIIANDATAGEKDVERERGIRIGPAQ